MMATAQLRVSDLLFSNQLIPTTEVTLLREAFDCDTSGVKVGFTAQMFLLPPSSGCFGQFVMSATCC